MASLSTKGKYGYDDSRFQKVVDDNFHCSICFNVLKEPRMCRNNEHIFCHDCITEHLNVNSHTCPECKEDLTVETLRRAPRLVTNYLSELKINCDYADRGCHEYVRLHELDSHVEACGFAPVNCSNDECQMVINKREIIHHESAVCEYRKVKCHSCGRIEQDMKDMQIKTEKQIGAVKEDVNEIKEIVVQMFSKLTQLEETVRISCSNVSTTGKEDIVVIAGDTGSFDANYRSVERFSWKKNVWERIASLNKRRFGASSFVFGGELYVGRFPSFEVLDFKNELANWRLSVENGIDYTNDQATLVCGNRVVLVGGSRNVRLARDPHDGHVDQILELLLTPRFTRNVIGKMPEPRRYLAAELLEDKILIFGGRRCRSSDSAVDSVLEFDLSNNECRVLSRLPHPLSEMATVHWKDKVVLIGGRNKEGEVLNQVLMYSTAGKIEMLPSLLEARARPCAVITGNVIVVMGGQGAKNERLSSVEGFVLGGYSWEYLPRMNEGRIGATAELVPAKFCKS